MSIDRVSTNAQAQYLLSQIMSADQALDTTQAQVASGLVSTTYAGIGDKTAALEGAQAAADRATAYANNTQLAVTQTDLQNTQLTTLSSLATQLKTAITQAIGNNDGTGLMQTAQSIFDQASQILNSTDANGNYIYGGQIANQQPFTATSLSDLTQVTNGTPVNVSSFFQNGTQKKSVLVGDGENVQVGVLASDVGTQLMQALQDVALMDQPSGSLDGQLSQSQVNELSSGGTVNGVAVASPLTDATTAATNLNTATAANGDVYNQLQDAVTTQQSLSTLYQGFVSNIQDVDMGTAVTQLNQEQVALQAALEVTSRLGQVSLLNYLPTVTTG
jgi:flagellar hook-associated protein 3 FlgL